MVSFSSIATTAFVLLLLDLDNSFSVDAWTTTTVHHHHHHHYRASFFSAAVTTTATTKNTKLHNYSPGDGNNDSDPLTSSYFHMQQIPTATSGKALDHIVDCADNGECDIEEMMNMIDELDKLNAECEGEHSRECNLDAVAARNVLKVALASKVMVEDALQEVECPVPENDDPYASMADLEDECQPDYYHKVPSDTTDHSKNLDRIIECAADGTSGECDVDEMTKMVEELEKLNMECESTLSRECSLDAVAARNILKVALASKVTLEGNVETRANGAQPWANGSP